MLSVDGFTFKNAIEPLEVDLLVKPYTRLFERVNDKDVAKLVERSKADVAAFQGESKESKKTFRRKKMPQEK